MKSVTGPFVAWSLAFAALAVNAQPAPPEKGFLCCNMRTDGSWISDSNYAESGKRIIPLGTPVRFLGYGRFRVNIEIEGRRQSIGNDYSRDLSMEQFATRYIVPANPKEGFNNLDAKTRLAIETARVTRGMTREQVIAAIGYPISSETTHLDFRQWRYWLWTYSPYTVNFGEDGKVTSVTTDGETLLKVFLD